jgi:uncharacterized OsmC-like protein
MTLRLYAQRKRWDLQRITVRLRHYRIHAEDCQECETKQGFLDRIDREIEMTGNLDAEQKNRLREIADARIGNSYSNDRFVIRNG